MAFRTITARFPGTCQRCKQPIRAGQSIRYGGRGKTYHLAAQCPGKAQAEAQAQEPADYRGCSHDDIAREGGYEDTMGVSPDALEAYRNGGEDYWDREAAHDFFGDDR